MVNLAIGCDAASLRFSRPRFRRALWRRSKRTRGRRYVAPEFHPLDTRALNPSPPGPGNCAVRISMSVIEETASCRVNNGKTGSIRRVPTKDEKQTRRRQQTEGRSRPPAHSTSFWRASPYGRPMAGYP